MDYTQILLRPLISEKSTLMKEMTNQVVFFVHQDANKIEVGKAVEQAFGVKVDKVNIVTRSPQKRRRFGRVLGRKPGYKKAYVKLAEGHKIDLFEGV